MSSHVPFLAVRPDEQFSSEVKKTAKTAKNTASAVANSLAAPSSPVAQTMDSPPPLTPAPPKVKEVSRIPANLRFPLLVVVSFGLSTLFHTLTADLTGIQLATASRAAHSSYEIGALLAWRVVGLFGGWVVGYDCMCCEETENQCD